MKNFKVAFAAIIASYAFGILVGVLIDTSDGKHPTYHCDGSTTMGYAVPGTPEAAACWIEEKK